MGQTDAGGGKKKKMKERARRKGRKEGRKEGGVAICLLGPGIGFGFRSPAGRTDGGWRACGGASGPAARRAAAAAIIERGIHAFLPRCTPTSTPTYGRCRLFCPAAAVITSTRVAGGRTVVLLLRRPTDRAAPKDAIRHFLHGRAGNSKKSVARRWRWAARLERKKMADVQMVTNGFLKGAGEGRRSSRAKKKSLSRSLVASDRPSIRPSVPCPPLLSLARPSLPRPSICRSLNRRPRGQ